MTAMSAILLHPTSYSLGHIRLLLTRLLQRIVDAEAGWFLPRRELLKGLEELTDDGLCRNQHEHTIRRPLGVENRPINVSSFERIAAKIKKLRKPQLDEWLLPNTHSGGPLLDEVDLPITNAQRH